MERIMIEKFSKEEFEKALPVHKETGEPLWRGIGLFEGEQTYAIPIMVNNEYFVTIMIRSSIDSTGFARDTGKDSIRLYFMLDGKPHGSKVSCYITRVKGWQDRLKKQLRIMYQRGGSLSLCPFCKKRKAMYQAKKDKKLFQACPEHFGKTFELYEGK
jgi:hypothetical protein